MTPTGALTWRTATTDRRRRKSTRACAHADLRIVDAAPRGAPPRSARDVVTDLAALIETGVVEAIVDAAGGTRYRIVDIFAGEGAFDDATGGAA